MVQVCKLNKLTHVKIYLVSQGMQNRTEDAEEH